MADLKTKPNLMNVDTYLQPMDEEKQKDARRLIHMMADITGEPAIMWGSSIIGFGQKTFHYVSGRKIEYFLLGFSMRKHAITLYLTIATNQRDFSLLGPHTKGVGCLYLKKLSEINQNELYKILQESYLEAMKA